MTLQQQYNLIKEGKGNKDFFLKQARHLFPEYLTVHNTYDQTIGILQGKSVISEAIGGVISLDNKKPDWFKIFDSNLNEAIGVKAKKEYGDQNEFDKIDTEVAKDLESNFDNKDPKNIDNVYGQAFLNGYYTEMKDPKNGEKTVDELKQIVAKNLGKDINYYVKDGAFGVKGLGYSSEPTGGEPKPPKGKYKSSGYGDLPKVKAVKENLSEAKKLTIQKRIQELEKQNEILALESKITSIDEAITELKNRLALTETDEMKELVDPKKSREMTKEIKILEKYKAKCEKIYEKMSKGKKSTPSDEDIINEYFEDSDSNMINEYFNSNLKENENPYYSSDPTDGDSDFDMKQTILANELYEKGLEAYSEGELLKAERLYKSALKAGSWLHWDESDLPPYETLNK